LRDYVHGALTPPRALDWSKHAVRRFPLWGNDELFDCTCVAAGHLVELWTAVAKGSPSEIGEPAVIAAYSAVSGYDPKTGAPDGGAHMLDVLKHWRRHGIGGHKIAGFAYVDPGRRALFGAAIATFGGAYLGFKLPLTAKRPGTWDVPKEGLAREGKFGSWGGHTVCVLGFDPEGITVATFGARKRVTWAFVEAYADEAYVAVSHDFLKRHSDRTPSGLAIDALIADLPRFEHDSTSTAAAPLDARTSARKRATR
jgi:hypothetical protein